jgi:hypothetical protein
MFEQDNLRKDAGDGSVAPASSTWPARSAKISTGGKLARPIGKERGQSRMHAKAGSWDREIAPPPQPFPQQSPHRVAISSATQAFLDEFNETAAFATHKKISFAIGLAEQIFRPAWLRHDGPVGDD